MLTISELRQKIILPFALALIFLSAMPVNSKPIKISARSNVNTIQGRSGGKVNSRGCGFIRTQPNQVIKITERINFMRVSVSPKGGKATLLIKGPNGNLCSMNKNPEISGMWVPGTYSIYVGDCANCQHDFTLTISRQK